MIKCDCSSHGICTTHSNVKMVVLLNWKSYHLKKNGRNPVFYSYVKDNHKRIEVIIEAMLSRLEKNYKGHYNRINFYDNHTKQLMYTFTP